MSNRAIPEEEITDALTIYAARGLNAAERESGMSKKTILKYAAQRGVASPAPQDVRDQATIMSIRAAQVRSRRVNQKIDKGIDRTVNLLELAQAREIQVLMRMDNPKPEDLNAITRARTTAVKDLEMLLRRAGLLVGSADGSEFVDIVRVCIRGAFKDIDFPEELQAKFSEAFAHRLRVAQGADDPSAGVESLPALEAGTDEDYDDEGESEA